ncbi:hypothetical protein BBJ28_00002741 [Nothophytophthora sp. Chile5]|nr:hypothetical protein BBJ28_00002741 [Nothophytophthora sp. Chile5]
MSLTNCAVGAVGKSRKMEEVAPYVELCTRLSRFVQLHPTDTHALELQEVLNELVAFYDRIESVSTPAERGVDTPLIGLAAMDDLVLLSLHKLLSGFVLSDSTPRLKERGFIAMARVLRRCKPRLHGRSGAQLQRHLSFVQTCVLYLPPPSEAIDRSQEEPDGVTLASQSEELRLAILQSLRELFDKEASDLGALKDHPLLLEHQQTHFFAYLVACLLHVAQRDRCREAAFEAVDTLASVLTFIHDTRTLRQFLPGISAGLWKCANSPQQASKVIVAALSCLATAIRLCIGDETFDGDSDGGKRSNPELTKRFTLEAIRQAAEPSSTKKPETTELSYPPVSPAKLSEEDKWLDATAMNLDLLLSRMFAASITGAAVGTGAGLQRASWRVRRALAELCGTVMLQCRRSLRGSFFRCYDELLVLRGDSIAEVAQEAQAVLQELQTSTLSTEERLRLLPEMADRFQMLLTTLVLKISTEHESTKVHMVRTLHGYVTFLGSSLTPYLDAAMETMYSALCRVVTFAALDIELVVHQTLPNPAVDAQNASAGVVVSQFQKRLRHFHEEASVREVFALLHEVGAVATPASFIDCAFTLLVDPDAKVAEDGHLEVVLVLNELLRAHCRPENEGEVETETPTARTGGVIDVHLIGRILEDLLALEEWREYVTSTSSSASRALVYQRALMIECVGVCAEILGSGFRVFLLHVLYPLVEQLGSRDVEMERAALAALEKVYFFTGYASLEALFEVNMDYFVDALCARLEQLDTYPLTAFVVEALLKHTRLAALPLVDEVASSLLRSVDMYQDSPHIGGLLRSLQLLIGSIARDAGESATEDDNEQQQTKQQTKDPPSLLASFIDEMKMLTSEGASALDVDTEDNDRVKLGVEEDGSTPSVKGAMPLEYDEIQHDGVDDGQEDDSGPSAPSGYRALVIDILDRCGYFLAESDPIACCLVLSVIDEGVRFMARPRKHLLPLVARLWPELLPRLRVDNRAIVAATVRVITTLAELADDFVGDRFVETVWPVLRSHLNDINVGADGKASQLTRSMLLLSKPSETAFGSGEHQESTLETSAGGELVQGRDTFAAVNGTRKTQEVRLLVSILTCLTTVCQRSQTVSVLVPEITQTCSKYLSSRAPREVVEQTSELFKALVRLNGDEVFCTVAALSDWVLPPPPSTRFAAFEPDAGSRFYRGHLSSVSGRGQSYRENAAILMSGLFC